MKPPKYEVFIYIGSLSIELCPSDYGKWMGASSIESWGDSLPEIIDNAVVWFIDKDGGAETERAITDLDNNSINLLNHALSNWWNENGGH